MTPPFDAIAQIIEQFQQFLIVSHVSPDGDALGSALGLSQALHKLGKEAIVVSREAMPLPCRFLKHWQDTLESPPHWDSYVLFVLDCDGTPKRISAPYSVVENASKIILIDHHRTSEPDFDVNWIDSTKPATALMIFELLDHLKIPLDKDICESLGCGLSTDTGHFRYPNVTPAALRAMATMIEHGADNARIAFKLFEERSLDATRLAGLALSKMRSENGGNLMWTALSRDDLMDLGIGESGSEGVVNMLRNIRGARMAIVMRERQEEDGNLITSVSVRADAALRADLFCAKFGGGGHAAASGCRLDDASFDDSVHQVVEAAKEWVAGDAAKTIAAQV
jgi:phosphoesterase RecJ-like protein